MVEVLGVSTSSRRASSNTRLADVARAVIHEQGDTPTSATIEKLTDAALPAIFTSLYEGRAELVGLSRQALEGGVPAGFSP